ncbi:Xaa-Pro dipeptidase [Escherichia coli]|uniref:Xaa-Pro dipeptidase n=1 Tax=Escherichia coli TaxID=562 RepID=A0A377B7R7_ECOLX|nr:Xaa-Pro dipeptidase [Escherichia coli]
MNPQFKAWVPVTQVPNCWLLVDGVNKPKLWFYLPVDYWHNVEPLPTSFWTEDVEVIALPKPMALVVCCLLRAAISVISVRCRNVRCNWVLRPATSTERGESTTCITTAPSKPSTNWPVCVKRRKWRSTVIVRQKKRSVWHERVRYQYCLSDRDRSS